MRLFRTAPLVLLSTIVSIAAAPAAATVGYYRQPTLCKDGVIFVAEGDLWKVAEKGGEATRLTSNVGDESLPAVSPDGKTVAFAAQYDGPTEVYTMPLAGGVPRRRTFDGAGISFIGWTPDGKVLVGTDAESTLPQTQLVALDISKKIAARQIIPLAQAADGTYNETGKTLYFTRLPFQGSHTKRYKGGTAQNLWKYADGADEAAPLTPDYTGTSKNPMWWQGRVYFLTDRDGAMNIWSMKPDGSDLKQHTTHAAWDAMSASLYNGRIVYQLGADIRLFDIASGEDRVVPITLESDFDQEREHIVSKPMDYLTSAHLSPDGDRVALTARGRVFVAPARTGRFVEVERKEGVRYREAHFLSDKSLVALSDETGEVELWTLPADGVGDAEQLTKDAEVLRWNAVPSPDGKRIAHYDKNLHLFIYDVEKKENKKIDETKSPDGVSDLAWSPDGKWLSYAVAADNMLHQIKVYSTADGTVAVLTTDRYDSYSPAWSRDGHWLYFLSDRNFKTSVEDPWGTYQPEPFLDKKTKIFQIALTDGLRSPWLPKDEKSPKDKPADASDDVKIDLKGIQKRLYEAPIPAGNYSSLAAGDKVLFWLATPAGDKKASLKGVEISNDDEDVDVKDMTGDVKSIELSQDGKKLLVQKDDDLYVIDASASSSVDLAKKDVPLSDWTLTVKPREEWKQMFAESWRLERDYFYDPHLHGVDWKEVRKKYEPLAERVASRKELADLIGQMVSELSALHIFVHGGDVRKAKDDFPPSFLGAVLTRDEKAGGYRVDHVYETDPDEPGWAGPLSRPHVHVQEGDVIESINGTATLSVPDVGVLLRRQADKQVLLRVKPADGVEARDVVVKPIDQSDAADLRYHDWEYSRRKIVEDFGNDQIGYVHLRAMESDDYGTWAREFYPVFTRQGLIIDMRNNEGGNIDSWILNRLLRKAWFFWSNRVGQAPQWNMQYAFRGHVVVICNENTASDGEAFTEGVKRLGIGKVIGTRTWGGEIWLNGDDYLVDKGIATAAEFGVYGPEGKWLIENHGVDPDMVVDNPPHATFQGEDAQLKAAIAYLQKEIKEHPVEPPPQPPFPNKAFPEKKPVGK